MLNRFEYAGKNDKRIKNYRFWQKVNDAQEIFLNDFFNQELKSIQNNPVKAEFVNRAKNPCIVNQLRHNNSSDPLYIKIGLYILYDGFKIY